MKKIVYIAIILVFAFSATARVCIIVNSDLYPSVRREVKRLASDIECYSKKSFLIDSTHFDETTSIDTMRNFLRYHYMHSGLEGAILIGDLPIAYYEIQNDHGVYGYKYFPMDYYFMDLDGTWHDDARSGGDWGGNARTGRFDGHDGRTTMEIWVSRIVASVLTGYGDEETIVKGYMKKVQRWMRGQMRMEPSAVVIGNTHDWPGCFNQSELDMLGYAGVDIDCSLSPDDTKLNWIRALTHGYQYACNWEHSSYTHHSFSGGGAFTTDDYIDLFSTAGDSSHINFYNLFNCSISRYIHENLGGLYALGHDGPLSVGSSKTGAMRQFEFYHEMLGKGENFGESFKNWVNRIGLTDKSWYYGMCLQGVGVLRLIPDPIPVFARMSAHISGGREYIDYFIDVVNADNYPNGLFAAAPHLPPCGLNHSASRTWVDIYRNDGAYVYGFCALGSSRNMEHLGFGVRKDGVQPESIYMELEDRENSIVYRSNAIAIPQNLALPPFNVTFSSPDKTRGYWFKAPLSFYIKGLRVPDEGAHGKQTVEVVRFNGEAEPPAWPGAANTFTSLFRTSNVRSSAILNTNILVRTGDIIGILGAAGDTTKLYSSYGGDSFVTGMYDHPITLKRLGMQHNLAKTAARDLWTENGSIGRVELFYSK